MARGPRRAWLTSIYSLFAGEAALPSFLEEVPCERFVRVGGDDVEVQLHAQPRCGRQVEIAVVRDGMAEDGVTHEWGGEVVEQLDHLEVRDRHGRMERGGRAHRPRGVVQRHDD